MERRRSPRLKVELEVSVTSDNNFYATHSRDISEGGVFVENDAPMAIGTVVQVQLDLDGVAIAAEADVAWQLEDGHGRVTGTGLHFTRLGDEARDAIHWFMLQREPMLFEDRKSVV